MFIMISIFLLGETSYVHRKHYANSKTNYVAHWWKYGKAYLFIIFFNKVDINHVLLMKY